MRRTILSLGLGLMAMGCVTLEPASPFRQPREAWLADVATICVFGLHSEIAFEGAAAERLEALERVLDEELRGRGFEIVDAEATEAVFAGGAAEAGDVFDPHNGLRDDARYEQARQRGLRALARQLSCDATLRARLVEVLAPWDEATVRWDGAAFRWGSRGYGAHGFVGALSLWVTLHSMEGEIVYFGAGGIEPTALVEGEGFDPIRTSQLLASDARNRAGVDRALVGLERLAPATRPGTRSPSR